MSVFDARGEGGTNAPLALVVYSFRVQVAIGLFGGASLCIAAVLVYGARLTIDGKMTAGTLSSCILFSVTGATFGHSDVDSNRMSERIDGGGVGCCGMYMCGGVERVSATETQMLTHNKRS